MKKIIKTVLVVFVLFIGIVLYAISHQVGGLRAFIVSSGSMEPTISTGSLIVTQYIHPTLLKKNDVITFIQPTKERLFITHRIVHTSQKNNLTVIKTKGDHNNEVDNWVLAGGGVVGKQVFALPYLGYFFSFTQTKIGLLALILIPSIFLIFSELESIFHIIKTKYSPATIAPVTMTLSLLVMLCLSSLPSTKALLSDNAKLLNNSFMITPITSHLEGSPCTISIQDNAADVTNNVSCNTTKVNTINQNNYVTVINSVTLTNNSGENTQ